jgi:hypothetical protein
MADWSKFQDLRERMGKGEFDLETDTLKIALSNTAPNLATMTVLADITEITAGNGYVAGGVALANKSWVETAGVGTLDADDMVITASGGAIATFRYVYLYDDTATNKPLLLSGDLGEAVDLSDGEAYTLQWNALGIMIID